MAFCANCIHFDYEHTEVELGAKCAATMGAFGDSSFLELGEHGERCECSGFEPEPIGADV